MFQTLWKWFLFTVLISLCPFLVIAIRLWNADQTVQFQTLWPHGELLLLSTALAADAIGDLAANPAPISSGWRTFSTFCCVITLFVASVWYAFAQDNQNFSVSKTSEGSIVLFLFTLLACFSAKVLAEEKNES
jgi:hypothetical protein